jgi:excisionase family DNA binding protein
MALACLPAGAFLFRDQTVLKLQNNTNCLIISFSASAMMSNMETYLTVEEVAAAVKFSVQTIRRYVLREEIPYHKIKRAVRFRPSEIELWIENRGEFTSTDVPSTDVPSTDVRGGLEGDLFAGVETGEAGE